MFALPIAFVSDATLLQSRIIEAAVFKSGLVYLTREVTVPAGSKTYRLDTVPTAVDGTFWYDSPDGLVLRDVRTRLEIVDKKTTTAAKTIPELIAANVGKRVTLWYERGDKQYVSTGTIVEAGGAPYQGYLIITLKLDDGTLASINGATVTKLKTAGLKATKETVTKDAQLQLLFSASIDKPKRLRFVTMEKGAAWTGSYLVTLLQEHKATIEGKAQVAVGGLKLENTNTAVLAGYPNLPSNLKYDLASGIGTLAAYLQSQQESFIQYRPGPRDPFALIPQLLQQRQNWANQGYAGGGFGGGMGGGGAAGAIDYISFDPTDNSLVIRDNEPLATNPNAGRVESLYAYPMGPLTLLPGDRLTRRLFKQDTTYTSLFKWNAIQANQSTVYNVVRLVNDSKVPWTGGLALIVKSDLPLAQLDMPFTGVGQPADLTLGTAPDIVVSRNDRTLRTEDYKSPDFPRAIMKKVFEEVTLTVQNTRDEAATLETTLGFTGEAVDPAGSTVTQNRGLSDQYNTGHVATWTQLLQPGEKRQLVFTYARIQFFGYP